MTVSMSFTAYVDSAAMGRAVSLRLHELCAERGVSPQIRVVDVTADPRAAEEDNVIGVPTVVREAPDARRRVVGALEEAGRVVDALGLDPLVEPGGDVA